MVRFAPVKLAAFALGCAALAWLLVYAGAGAVVQAALRLGLTGLCIVALLHAPVLAAMGIAWWNIGRDASGAALGKFVAARFVRDAVSEVLPLSQLGGFAAGVRALHLAGVSTLCAAASMFADLVAEFAAKLPYVVAGIAVLAYLRPWSALALSLLSLIALMAAGGAALFALRRRVALVSGRLAATAARRWAPLRSLEDFRQAVARLARHDRPLIAAFAIHAACWFFGAVETWIIFALMGVELGVSQALVIDALVSALRTFAFLVPGAIGIQEGSYVAACALFGIGPADAIAFSVVRRARELALGAPGLAAWQWLEARAVTRTES
ncbi:MAG: flippase-like domain-containing protein [Alphaproteobacteria bacterium]|nr:flippase-like domain-containing protein [Alphaproteobacteria bacterium]